MLIKISLDDVELFGRELQRPEGVMVARDGTVWCAHGGGGCTRIDRDGSCETLFGLGGQPNGICIDVDGSLVVANIGGGCVQRLYPDGRVEMLADSFDGRNFTTPNFPLIDSRGRLWVTNSTRRNDYKTALRKPQPDGSLCLVVDGAATEAAGDLNFANGVALDSENRFVYVAETFGRRVVRYEINGDHRLGAAEQYGPALGESGHPDGIAFDAAGNLWVTLPSMNALGVIDPDGRWSIVLDDAQGTKFMRPTNICFGGADLRTAYVGSLRGESLLRFRVPHPGLPLVHQE